MNLNELRKEIDAIDEQVVNLLNRRASIAQEIGHHKSKSKLHHYTPEREQSATRRRAGGERRFARA